MALAETISNAVLGGSLGAFIAAFLVFFILIVAAVWIYTSLVWAAIGRKLKHRNPWLAWIPFARTGLVLGLGKFHWAWAFLWLIPIIGWAILGVLCIIAHWRIFEIRNYPGWLALIPLAGIIPLVGGVAGIAYLVILGIVAWKDNKKRR